MIQNLISFICLIFNTFNLNFFIIPFFIINNIEMINIFTICITLFFFISYFLFFTKSNIFVNLIEEHISLLSIFSYIFYIISFFFIISFYLFFLNDILTLYIKLPIAYTVMTILSVVFIAILINTYTNHNFKIALSFIYILFLIIIVFLYIKTKLINQEYTNIKHANYQIYFYLSKIPLLLMPILNAYMSLEKEQNEIRKIIIFLISFCSFYYIFIQQTILKIPKIILLKTNISKIFLHFFKENFYIIQCFNIFLISLTMYVMYRIYLFIINYIQLFISTIYEKKNISEMSIFFVMSLIIFFLSTHIKSPLVMLNSIVLCFSLSSFLFYINAFFSNKIKEYNIVLFYSSLSLNVIIIIICIFNIIFS